MEMRRHHGLLCLFIASCLFFSGCGGDGDNDFLVTNTSGGMPILNPPAPTADFSLKPGVQILTAASKVESVAEGQVTLSGDTSGIAVGSVIVSGSGPNTFIRRVVSITQNGGATVLTTEPATAADVFATANISQTNLVDPAAMITPGTEQPGLRMQTVTVNGRVSEELLNSRSALQIDLENFIVQGDDGQPLARMNGQIFAVTGFTTSLEIDAQGNQRAGNNPQTAVFGNVTVDFLSNAHGNVSARLVPARTVQMPPLAGVVPLTAKVELFFNFNGYGFKGSRFTFSSGRNAGEGSQISTSYGFDPAVGFGASSAEFSSQWSALTSALSGNQADFAFSPFSMRAFIAWPANPDNLGSLWTLNPLTFIGQPSGTNGYTLTQRSNATRFHVVKPASFQTFEQRYGSLTESFQGEDRILAGIASNDNVVSRSGLISTNPPGPIRIGVGETVIVSMQTEGQLDYGLWQVLPQAGGGLPAVSLGRTGNTTIEGTNVRIRGERVGTSTIQINHLRSDLNQTDLRVEVVEQPATGELVIKRSLDPFDSPFFVPELESNHIYTFEALFGNQRVGKDATWSVEGNSALLLGPGFIQTGGPGPLAVTASFGGRTTTLRFNIVGSDLVNLDIVSPSNDTLTVGSSRNLDAFASYIDGSRRRVTDQVKWSAVPADQFGTVSETGVVRGTSEGALLATATLENLSAALRVLVGIPRLNTIEILPANSTVGFRQSVQLQARGTFSDGSARILKSTEVVFTSPGANLLTSPAGLVTGLVTGREVVLASPPGGGPIASTVVEVLGPNALSVAQGPTTPVQPNTAFTTTVQAVGPDGAVVTSFNGTVTVRLGANPSDATLSGTLTAQAVNGVATFNDIRISNAGNGYTLVFSADTLGSAISTPFNVAAPAGGGGGGGGLPAAGRLIVASNSSTNPSLGVALVNGNGTVGAPVLTAFTTSPLDGRPNDVERIGNFVYTLLATAPATAPTELRLASMGYNATSGALTAQANTGNLGDPRFGAAHMATNGTDALFVLNQRGLAGNLTAQPIDSATGAFGMATAQVTVPTAATFGSSLAYLTDVAVNAGGMGGPLVLTLSMSNEINVYRYTGGPATPTLTLLDSNGAGGGPTTDNPAGPFDDPMEYGGKLMVIGDRLYITNKNANSITRYDINTTTGELTGATTVGTPGGALNGPQGMHLVGTVLFVANTADATVSSFRVDAGTGALTFIQNIAAGGAVPKEFDDIALPGGQQGLYVSTSANTLGGFTMNTTTGVLTPIGTFGGYTNPFAITH